jgi:transposase
MRKTPLSRLKACQRKWGNFTKAVKGVRYALLKNPENLTERQGKTLECVEREDKHLYRAYLLKERLRDVFKTADGAEAKARLDSWLQSACHSGMKIIRELSKKVRRHRDAIVRAVTLGISNARVEATNNKIKLTVRMGYGFRNIDNLVALVMLRCSNLPITLPGRA